MLSTIRSRILFLSTAALVISLALTGAITYHIVRENSLETIRQNLDSITGGHALAIEEWVAARTTAVAAATDAVREGDRQAVISQLQKSGGFRVATLGLQDKTAYTSSAAGLPPAFDPTARPWYREAAQAGRLIVTRPYADVATGNPMVSFAAPVMQEGKMLGVVSAAVLLDGVRDVIGAVHPTPSSLGFVIDGDGVVIAHPDTQWLKRPAEELSPALTAGTLLELGQEGEPMEVALAGAAKLLRAKSIRGTSWTLVVALDKAEGTAGMNAVLQTSAIAILVLGTIVTLLVGFLTAAAFRRLSQVRDAMFEIGSGGGDLTRRLPVKGRDEVAQIAEAFNAFAAKMNGMMQQVRAGSEAVRGATSEIAAGNQDLSRRTEQAASALQQTAASLSQLTGSLRQSADATGQASQLASSASTAASEGGDAMSGVIVTMDEIARASNKVVDIIAVIDGLAFQTNLLALNAAVEAARAGEHGRGFAVVAGEVRNLAQRCSGAAQEIRTLIEASQAKVTHGAQRVEEAGAAMSRIVESIGRVNAIMADIDNAMREQSDGLVQINQAVVQMDDATQQNAALVEQAASASTFLETQAHKLGEVVAGFRLHEAEATA